MNLRVLPGMTTLILLLPACASLSHQPDDRAPLIRHGAILNPVSGIIAGNDWSQRMADQKQAIEQATQGTGVIVSQTGDDRLKLEIPASISFDSNRSDIKSNFRPVLDLFASTLKKNPASIVTIIGYTDETGSDAINFPLSLERATHTRDYLVLQGVAVSRLMAEGRGSTEPLAQNDDNGARARNRRVEIYVAEPIAQPCRDPE